MRSGYVVALKRLRARVSAPDLCDATYCAYEVHEIKLTGVLAASGTACRTIGAVIALVVVCYCCVVSVTACSRYSRAFTTVIRWTSCTETWRSVRFVKSFYPPWDGKWVSAFGLSNNNKWRRRWLQTIAAYRRTRSPSQVAWSEGRRPIGAVLHSSNEPSELSQWPCGHDDSTINTVMGIIIIIIKYCADGYWCKTEHTWGLSDVRRLQWEQTRHSHSHCTLPIDMQM